jgi:HEAT repeat protein
MLVKAAMDQDIVVRQGALKVLSTWGTKDTAPAFIEFLGDKCEPGTRHMAHAALGALKDPRGAPAVARWAGIDVPVAMNALNEMGPVAEDTVIELLNHERADIRIAACRILKSWGTRKAIPALTAALQRDRLNLEMEARDALTAIRERPAIINRRLSTQPARSPQS